MVKKIFTLFAAPLFIGLIATSCDSGSSSTNNDDQADDQTEPIQLPPNPNSANNQIAEDEDSVDENDAGNQSLEESYADQVFALINQERVNNGLQPLARNIFLDGLCKSHNEYMISINTPNGTIVVNHDNAQTRFNAAQGQGATGYGENTAGIRGFGSAQVALTFVNGWINSPGHYANILGNFTQTGISITINPSDGTVFATQIFIK